MFRRSMGIIPIFLLLTLVLAACGDSTATPAPAAQTTAAAQTVVGAQRTPNTTLSGKLEVFSWWTSGGEAAALDALFKTYTKNAPKVEIINATVAGGGGSAARPVLQTRLSGGDPPDTWQVHPGWELLGQSVEPGFVEPITDLYKSEGWDKVMPQGIIDTMTKNGQIY